MALHCWVLPSFAGVQTGETQNMISSGNSPDACNMDTSGGMLSVAKGFTRYGTGAFSAPDTLLRLTAFLGGGGLAFLVAATDGLYAYNAAAGAFTLVHAFSSAVTDPVKLDFLELTVNASDCLLAADGQHRMQKWAGGADTAAFGSAEGLSDMPQTYAETYYGRLFCAGDPDHKSRLYWSQAPGDTRTVEAFSADAASSNVSGGHVEVGTGAEPITGLFALSNQLLVFKRDTLYRLLGDRPSNYRVLPVDAAFTAPVHTACVKRADRLFFLTAEGLSYYDGQTVRRTAHGHYLSTLLKKADLSRCMGASCGEKLYFAVKEQASAVHNDVLIEYDVRRDAFMLRRGFETVDMYSHHGQLYLLTGAGTIVLFGQGTDYDGTQIDAHWETPRLDMDSKLSDKQLIQLSLTGTGGAVEISALSGSTRQTLCALMPEDKDSVLEAPLCAAGRRVRVRIANRHGSSFTIDNGLELLFDAQRRPV